MIGRLRGTVIERVADQLTVDVGGVGYVVRVTPQSPHAVGEDVDLHVHTQVREDAINLYGFSDSQEREVFNLLIGVPNIGPVKAMQILRTPVAQVIELVVRREPGPLAKLPGVGKKTAERILVDLPDKFAALGPTTEGISPRPPPPMSTKALTDLTSALVNLGFRASAAEEMARGTIARHGEEVSLETLLRAALNEGAPRTT